MTQEETLKQLEDAIAPFNVITDFEFHRTYGVTREDVILKAAKQYARLLKEEIEGVSKCVPVDMDDNMIDVCYKTAHRWAGILSGHTLCDLCRKAIKAAPSRLMED